MSDIEGISCGGEAWCVGKGAWKDTLEGSERSAARTGSYIVTHHHKKGEKCDEVCQVVMPDFSWPGANPGLLDRESGVQSEPG